MHGGSWFSFLLQVIIESEQLSFAAEGPWSVAGEARLVLPVKCSAAVVGCRLLSNPLVHHFALSVVGVLQVWQLPRGLLQL